MHFFNTANGWQDTESFWGYLKAIDRQARARGVKGKYVIYCDGYPAHMDLDIYLWCRERGIIFIILYPNATHLLQPCDVVAFKPMKSHYATESAAYKEETNKKVIDEVERVYKGRQTKFGRSGVMTSDENIEELKAKDRRFKGSAQKDSFGKKGRKWPKN